MYERQKFDSSLKKISWDTLKHVLEKQKPILRELSSGRIAADQKKIANSMRTWHSFTDKGNS